MEYSGNTLSAIPYICKQYFLGRFSTRVNIPKEAKLTLSSELTPAHWTLLRKCAQIVGKLSLNAELGEQLLESILKDTVDVLSLHRCELLLINSEKNALEIKLESSSDQSVSTKGNIIQLPQRSEFYKLLSGVKPLPLNDLIPVISSGINLDLEKLVTQNASSRVVALPLAGQQGPLGCLLIYYTEDGRQDSRFTEDFSDFCEVLAQQIASIIEIDFCLRAINSKSLTVIPGTDKTDESKTEVEGQSAFSKQLAWERWMRQIVCRVHSSLDRDSVLQSVVDNLGRALGVSRCMVVRTESVTSPIVTHEYSEPDFSPLGLGRTGQFPARIAGHFKTRVKAITDISSERPNLQISDEELEWFLDNGFVSIAGAPISHHGAIYGVVVAIACGAPRKWLPNELDMLEVAAAETAIAVENSQSFMQVKDQLFNMNLLGNLTQQLTNTLEMASRTSRPEGVEDKLRTEGGPPLSFRELEVLKLIASGYANREIAQRLFLTESTVELHASRIRKKLKLKSRTALVKYACDNDLV